MNRLAKISGAGTLVLAGPADTSVSLYVIVAGGGNTGSSVYAQAGDAVCTMDNATSSKAGTYLVVSASSGAGAGRCHQQDSPPGNGFIIGKLLATSTVVDGDARIEAGNIAFIPGTGGGSVTSAALTMPLEYTVVTTNPTTTPLFTVTKATQAANLIYAGPGSGAAAAPTFRALTINDLSGTGVAAGSCAGDLAGTFPNCTVKQSSTGFALTAMMTPSALTGDVSNYNPTQGAATMANSTTILIDGGLTDRNITGFASQGNGDRKKICNIGTTNKLSLRHLNSGSTAANQLLLGDDITLATNTCTNIFYVSALSKWLGDAAGVPDYLKLVPIGVIVGDPDSTSPALVDGNDTPQGWTNKYHKPVLVLDLACYALAPTPATATPTVQVRQAGTATSLLTADCTCGNGAWNACSVVTTSAAVINSFTSTATTTSCPTAPCALDFLTISATAGGGAPNYYVISGTGIVLQ